MKPEQRATRPAPVKTPPGGPPSEAQPKSRFSMHAVAWVVLAISLAASAGGLYISRKRTELEAGRRFDEEVNRITTALSERMLVYEGVLHGAVGLFAASYSVERGEWRAYCESVSIAQRFPGVDGVGFVAAVPREKLDEFLRITRDDKSPGFELRNSGTNADLLIIKYLEPEDRHRSRLGVDTGTDPERRAVAEKARDKGAAVISGLINMAENGGEPQGGFLMMVPVYRRGLPRSTVAERRAAIEGWVYARFITRQLMQGSLGDKSPAVHFEVFDGAEADPQKLIFDSDPQLRVESPRYQPQFVDTFQLGLSSRNWTLRFSSTPTFDASVTGISSWVVGAIGGLISLLLFGIARSLSTTRERALVMASDMTATLRGTNERLEREVQERKRAELSIRDSEALYHSLVESLPLHILTKDIHSRYTFANHRFCADVGKPLDELLGRTDADFFAPAIAAQHRQEDQQVLATGTTLDTVQEHPAGDGQARFVQAIKTPIRDGMGTVVGLLGIYWDVTDKHRAEQALARERDLLHTLMDNVPDRIYFKDAQSRFLRVNRALADLFHLRDPEEAVGKTDFDFFGGEHAHQAFDDEQRIIRTGEPMIGIVEKEALTDGSARWALTTKMAMRDKHGRIVGTFGVSRDYTQLKLAEEALRRAKEAAEAASRAKSQFLASMSHELRTPLNSVIGFANILLKNKTGNLIPTELNFLERIVANGKHLLTLINQILDLSKIEARKVELQIAAADLGSLVRETVAQQESLVRDKSVQLVAELPARMAPLQTDAERLKQVIINLIGNALKFTDRGQVTVRVATDPADDHPTRIDVIDTGIGIPHDKLGLIFEAFQQADAGTARKYGGTGLGLTISQALCQLMGYRIEVRSEVGKGSTFSVILKQSPAAGADASKAATVAETASERAGPSLLKGKLVLVIDDELDSRTLLTHMIAELGCQVIAANSGEQGLHMAREFRPQLITVDLMMPDVDGWEVVREIKADPQLRDTPVVVVSVVASENRGRVLGVTDVLQKPVAREDLIAVLQRNLSLHTPKVLVVDDDDDASQLLASYLEDVGAKASTAANGREALRSLEQSLPDLIILDLMMPVMDGMEFLSVIRADPRFRHVPVAVVTAKDLSAAEKATLRRQTLEVLRKADVFAEDLKRWLPVLLQKATRQARSIQP